MKFVVIKKKVCFAFHQKATFCIGSKKTEKSKHPPQVSLVLCSMQQQGVFYQLHQTCCLFTFATMNQCSINLYVFISYLCHKWWVPLMLCCIPEHDTVHSHQYAQSCCLFCGDMLWNTWYYCLIIANHSGWDIPVWCWPSEPDSVP